ncbi:iduronate-2-sulfatase [Haloferula helveola]|uniref:Iduronate-2-sulfatase n=1 Tax=Haloferula helveola TaxID=490095 RepID=A0ABM7R9C7_9BACT|nr:iduronate-2-sulfatase [Haloferula helveola]
MKPLAFLFALLAIGSLRAADRPNVLLIYIDDLKPMTRDYGEAHMHTPNFDRLAARGLRFERAYCQVPTCGASRASLMTSRYPTVKRFPDFKCWAEKDAPGVVTLPQRFKDAGYVTISNGKIFHHKDDTGARSWSEPSWRPKTSGRTFHNKETQDFMKTSTATRKLNGKTIKKVPMFEKSRIGTMESHDGLIAKKTMDDLERLSKSDKPFFIACGFAKPHMPFFAPESAWEPYKLPKIALAEWRQRPEPAPASLRQVREQFAYVVRNHALTREIPYNNDLYHRHMRQGYYACVTHVDDLTGRLLDKLDQLKLTENTVVVVLGDHGWLLGENGEWAKNQLLPEALRPALWMSGPGIAAGKQVDTFVEFVDIHPTLCELAGIEVDPDAIDGRSFAAVLKDPSSNHRDHAYTRFGPGDAITTESHFYVKWKTEANGEERMLIDLKADSLAKRNIAGEEDQKERIETLDRKLAAKLEQARN